MNMANRQTLRTAFLAQSEWRGADISPLAQDASFRQYFRLVKNNSRAILMDAPPQFEEIHPFLSITFHLQNLGIRVPEIMCHDTQHGFILMEDLGNNTYTSLLRNGGDETSLYRSGIDVLTRLHSNPQATDIDTGEYDFVHLIKEARLFIDWYLPARESRNKPNYDIHAGGDKDGDSHCQLSYIAAWQAIFDNLPQLDSTLVLRDYHVDNLMLVDNQCAVIDYQDALIGSPAYDIVSLLEDARRDISTNLSSQILARYFSENPRTDREKFMHHYAVWGAQRHCKVAGIFVRLWLRDNKPHYLKHLSRVMALLKNNLQHPALAPLNNWLDEHDISSEHKRFTAE